MGDAQRYGRAHQEFEVADREPGEALVGEHGLALGVADQRHEQSAGIRAGEREDVPLRGDVTDEHGAAPADGAVVGGLPLIVGIIGRPDAGGDEVVAVLAAAHDGEFGARRTGLGQLIGEVDATDPRQFIGDEPVRKAVAPGPEAQCLVKAEASINPAFSRIAGASSMAYCHQPPVEPHPGGGWGPTFEDRSATGVRGAQGARPAPSRGEGAPSRSRRRALLRPAARPRRARAARARRSRRRRRRQWSGPG